MDILVANPADIISLTQVEIQTKLDSIPQLLDAQAVDPDHRLRRWQTYFAGLSPASSKPPRVVYKAIVRTELVGYISGHLTTRFGLDAEIQSFYVLKSFQRQGIGRALCKHFVLWLLEQQARSLCVGIEAENPYRSFYLKYGGRYLNPHWIYWDNLPSILTQLA